MTGEPESFIELAEGRRLMVLRQHQGACALLGADQRCRAYAARPRDCRAFPFDFITPSPDGSAARRLTLLPLARCEYDVDGQNELEALETEDLARWSELRDYQALVARWNRRAWHRRRLRKSVGSAAAFLDFALSVSRSLSSS